MTAATRVREPATAGEDGEAGPGAAARPVRSGVELRSVRRPVPPRPLPARPYSAAGLGRTGLADPLDRPAQRLLRLSAPAACPPQPAPVARLAPAAAGPTRPSMTAYLVAAAVVTLVLVGGLGLLGGGAGQQVPAQTSVLRVGAGETVWDVARRAAPSSDPQVVVARMKELNGLVGSAVEPGQRLRVPVER